MNELFLTFFFFAIGSVFIVVIQAVALAMLVKWNKQLRDEVERNKPPF